MNTFFKNVVSKLLTATTAVTKVPGIKNKTSSSEMESDDSSGNKEIVDNKQQQQQLTELTISFIKHLDSENILFLLKVVKPLLQQVSSSVFWNFLIQFRNQHIIQTFKKKLLKSCYTCAQVILNL